MTSVNVLDLGLSPDWGYCVVFVGKKLLSVPHEFHMGVKI